MPLSRKRYTVKDKIDIVHWFRGNGSNYSATQREFGVDRKLIRTWNHDYEKLLMNSGGKTGSLKKIGAATPPMSMELDNAVFEWFVEERAEGRAVTNYMLQAQGRIIASQLRVDSFIASNGWLRRWKKRFSVGIRRGTNDAQKLPSDYQEKIAAFHDTIRHLRQANDYTAYNIANMDQTMVRFDTPFTTTNSMIGEKTVRITNSGGAKKGCTVALSATASGHKFPAYIIFKEKSGELSSRIQASLRIPPNVRVSASQNGWMTTAEVQRWIRRVWGPNTDDVRRLLTLDSYRPHTCPSTLEIFKQYDTDIVTIPGGCTGLVQPMDTHVNKVFKQWMRQQWTDWFRTAQRNKNGNIVQPTHQNVITWVSTAWASVTEETIIGSFLSCGISNSLSGSENSLQSRRLIEEVGVSGADTDIEEDIDGTRADGILFDSEESDDETLLFGGFDRS